MKIGIVVPKLAGGGAEYVACEWANYLAQAGVHVVLLTTEEVDELTLRAWPVVKLQGRSFGERARSLAKICAQRDLDVLVGLMPYWNLLALAAGKLGSRKKIKVVISSHTIESRHGVDRGRGFALQTALARVAYRFADALLASSHSVASEAIAKYGIHRDRLWVIPNPVFPELFVDKQRAKHLPFTSPPRALVVPGRLVAQKRPETAIYVAAALRERWGSSPEIIYIGEGPALNDLNMKSQEANVPVQFHDWDPSWPTIVPKHSVVLLPTMLEGFGNVLLDSTAAGLQVVASSRALGVADAIVPGVTGELVSGDSVDDYVKGVIKVSESGPIDPASIAGWLNRYTRENSGGLLLGVLSDISGKSDT